MGLRDKTIPGMEPEEPVFAIEAGGLIAAVSRVPAAQFEEEPLNDLLSDLARLAPYAVRHEEAVRALGSVAPNLVPAAFGRVYRGVDGVKALLQTEGPGLRRLLGELAGKDEWGLKVIKDAARLWAAAETASPRLQQLARQEAEAQPGRAYLLRRQRERLHGAEAARLEREALEGVLSRLRDAGARVLVEELPPHTPGEVEIALKGALLIGRGDADRLRETVGRLDQEAGSWGLSLELNGPWAPYSFIHPHPEADSSGLS